MADARLPAEAWREMLSEPRYDGVVETIHELTADDGTHLSLTLYLPDGLPADAQVPTVLEITPYQTLDRGLGAALTPDGIDPGSGWTEQVLRGMAFVRADARGTHASAGCLDFGGPADRSDARVFMDWIRAQPWSDGRIVTDGVSHPGMGSVVAHVADAGLTAAIATAPVVSYYMDEYFQGAHYDNQFNGAAYQAIELAPTTVVSANAVVAQAAPCTGQTTLDYDLLDGTWHALWQERDLTLAVQGHFAAGEPRDAPILLNHGFVDLAVQPDHSQIYWDALPDDHAKAMILGFWGHQWPDMEGHPAAYAEVRQRFFDHHLLGIDNGLEHEPRVLMEDSQGAWHESHDWPLDGSRPWTLWPSPAGLQGTPGEPAAMAYQDPLPTEQDAATGRLVFRTEPMQEDVLLSGQPVIELVAASDQTQTKWVAMLLDEAPDGTQRHISHAMTASQRQHEHDDEWRLLTPGEPRNWTMKALPTGEVVEKGHRIVLELRSQWSNQLRPSSQCFDGYCPIGILPSTTAGRAVNTVHLGDDGTRVHLFVSDPGATRMGGA